MHSLGREDYNGLGISVYKSKWTNNNDEAEFVWEKDNWQEDPEREA